MANYKIEDLEGVGKTYGEKLRSAGIKDTDTLLAGCKTKKQRDDLAKKTGLSGARLLKWTNMADLYRVDGIGSEYAELLEVAGVDSVPELAQRKADNLAKAMAAANEKKKLSGRVPTAKEIEKWIAQAKTLPRAVEH